MSSIGVILPKLVAIKDCSESLKQMALKLYNGGQPLKYDGKYRIEKGVWCSH